MRQKILSCLQRSLVSLLCFLIGSASFAFSSYPENGLVLHISTDQGLKIDDQGKVIHWQNLISKDNDFRTVAGKPAPDFIAGDKAVQFQAGSILVPGGKPLFQPDQRECSIFAVAEAFSGSSVPLLGFRHGGTPLVQLDVDEFDAVRFIVRNDRNQTLSASLPVELGTKTVFGGILRDDETKTDVSVFFGPDAQKQTEGARLEGPLFSGQMQIGGFDIPGLSHHRWNGRVSEILIYDRALAETEIQQVKEYLIDKHKLARKLESKTYEDQWNVLAQPPYEGPIAEELQCDVCVVGGGSSGCAAVVMAAREGADSILVERQTLLGGTGSNALVSGWEPGPGCTLVRELFERMKAINGAGVGRGHKIPDADFAYGLYIITDGEPYEYSTHRANVPNHLFRDVPFKPEAFDQVVRDMCRETGNVRVLDQTTFFQSETNADNNRVDSILVRRADDSVVRIRAKVFVDSTGDVWLCRSLGCETMLGIDSKDMFDEPSAPEEKQLQLNALTRCYEIARRPNAQKATASSKPISFPKCAHICGWEDGPLTVNMLPTFPGRALIDWGYDETLKRSEEIVQAHWHWLQQYPYFQDFELVRIAPMLGIREGYRVRTKYVLNENDLIATLHDQKHEDIIAIADHPCDIHGAGGGLRHVTWAYGIPYRCMVPADDWQNLLVACRGAGFSRIAASSCRLHRTMIQVGHAAGIAAAEAARENKGVNDIDAKALSKRLDAPSRYNEYIVPEN